MTTTKWWLLSKKSIGFFVGLPFMLSASLAEAVCTSNGTVVSWTSPANWVGTCTGGPNSSENVVVLAGTTVNFPAGAVVANSLVLNGGVTLVGNVTPTTLVAIGGVTFQGPGLSIQLNSLLIQTGTAGALQINHPIEINNSTLRNSNASATPSFIGAGVTVTLDGTANFINNTSAKLVINTNAQILASAVTAGTKNFTNSSTANNAVDIQGAATITTSFVNNGEVVFPNLTSVLTLPDGTKLIMGNAGSLLTGMGKIVATTNDLTIANGKVAGDFKFQVASGNKVNNVGAIFSPGLAVGQFGVINVSGGYSQTGTGRFIADIDATGADQISATEGVSVLNSDILYRQGLGADIQNSSGGKTIASTISGAATVGAINLQNVFTSTAALTPILIRTTIASGSSIVATRDGSRFVVTSLADNSTPGSGTLREGLTFINSQAPACGNAPYRVRFNTSGSISLLTDLPPLGACETGINAHQHHITEANFDLNASLVDDDIHAFYAVQLSNGGSAANGFAITGSGGARIAGLRISGFPTGIQIGLSGNTAIPAAIHDNQIFGGTTGISIVDGGAIRIGGAFAGNGTTIFQNRNVIYSNSGVQILIGRTILNPNQLVIEGNLIGAGPNAIPLASSGIGISVNDVNANMITENVIASTSQGISLGANSNQTLLNAAPQNRLVGGGVPIARDVAIGKPIFTYTYLDGSQTDGKVPGTTGDTHDVCICENAPGQMQCRKVRSCVPVTIDPSGFGPFTAMFVPVLPANTTLTAYAVSTGGSNVVRGTSELSAAVSLPAYTVTPASGYTFPNTIVGQQTSQTFTVQNTGLSPTQIDGVALNISNSTAFVIPPTSGSCQTSPTLGVGQTCTIVVQFIPTVVNAALGYLNISSVGFSGISITLNGTGIVPNIAVTPTGNISFPNTNLGATSPSQLVQIDNSGTIPLTVSAISVTAGFSLVADPGATCVAPPFTLLASASCSIAVAFSPTVSGAISGQLSIASNAGAAVIKGLDGTATLPNILTAAMVFLPGNAIVGQFFQLQVMITNTATALANGVSFSYTLPLGLVFASNPITSTCGGAATSTGNALIFLSGTLASSANCVIEATVSATAAGVFTVSLPAATSTIGGLISPAAAAINIASGAFISSTPANGVTVAFGTVTPPTSSLPLTVKITNDGNLPSSLSIGLIGTDAARFNFTGCATSLGAVSSCTILVTCTPTAAGALNAVLQVTHSATNLPATLQYPLTCTGGTPLPVSYLLAPASTTIASTKIGATSTATFTLTNGSGPLNISGFDVTGAELSIVSGAGAGTCPRTGVVAANAVCTIIVAYQPTIEASVTGQLSILSNAINTPSSTSNPSIANITASAPAAILSTPNSSFTFGTITTGSSSTSQSRILSNNTASSLTFTAFTAPTGYTVTDTCVAASPLAPNTTCIVTVIFAPTVIGAQNVSVQSRVSSAAIASGLTFNLLATGTGGTPLPVSYLLAPASTTIASTKIGATSTATFTLTNGSGPLNISGFDVSGAELSIVSGAGAGTCPRMGVVAANAVCTIIVAYQPTIEASVPGQLSILSNAINTPSSTSNPSIANITASAPAAILSTPNSSFTFGTITTGSSSTSQSRTLSNNTASSLTFAAFTAPTGYTVTDTCVAASPLAPNATCIVTVTFAPTVIGAQNVSVQSRVSSAAIASGLTFNLLATGTGSAPMLPILTATPSSLSFANQVVNQTSAPQSVLIRNTGAGDLLIAAITPPVNSGVARASATPGDTCTSAAIIAGASCVAFFTYRPTLIESVTGDITITSNAPTQLVRYTAMSVAAPAAKFEVDVQLLDFLSQVVNTQSLVRAITIRNTGDANMAVSIVSSGTAFLVNSNCPAIGGAQLSAGRTCDVAVSFKPTTEGNLAGSVTITHNASNTPSPVTVQLKGLGLPEPIAGLSFTPSILDFGTQTIGSATATPKTIVVRSSGAAAAKITSITNTGDFRFSSNCPFSPADILPPTFECAINVTFNPQTLAAQTGLVTVTSNAPITTVNGVASNQITLKGAASPLPVPTIDVSTRGLNFSSLTIGSVSQPQSIIITNAGFANLRFDGLSLVGTQFVLSGIPSSDVAADVPPCGSTLAPGGKGCWISVVFAPNRVGDVVSELAISSNVSGGPLVVTLVGSGLALPKPLIVVSMEALVFGEIVVNTTSSAQQITISNRGDAPLRVGTIAISSTDFALRSGVGTSCQFNGTVLAVGASCSVEIAFAAQTLGAKTALLSIASNSTLVDFVTAVRLSGTAIAAPTPLIRATVTALGFGNTVLAGATPSQSVVINNAGTAPLLITGISVTGDFLQNNNCAASLPAGASCTIAVSFSPFGLGSRAGELQIRANATPEILLVSLGGTGCRLFSILGSRTFSTLCAP